MFGHARTVHVRKSKSMSSSRSSSPAMQQMLALMALFLLLSGGVHAQVVPAVISFGDSTIAVGNNNYLPGAVFKAHYAPYGAQSCIYALQLTLKVV